MTNLQNPVQIFLQKQEYQSDVLKAKERFKYKPFYKRFELLKKCCEFNFLFHAFSILTGLTFLTILLDSILHFFWLSVLFAVIILSFWELAKSRIITTVFDLYYASKSPPTLLIVLSLAVISISVYASLDGVKLFHQLTDKSLNNLNAQFQIRKDSVIQYYDNAIASESKALSTYKKTVTWRGQIDMSNTTTKQVISSHTSTIDHLKSDKRSALKQISNEYLQDKNTTIENSGFNQNKFIVIACINEILILIMSWFLVFYDFKIAIEDQILSKVKSRSTSHDSVLDTINKHSNALGADSQFYQFMNSNADKNVDGEIRTPIGFRTKSRSKRNSSISNVKYLSKYQHVINAINKGLREQEIIGQTGVGRTTLYKIKAILRTTHSLESVVEN